MTDEKRTRDGGLAVAMLQCEGSANPSRNAERIVNAIRRAGEIGADILLTPECALSGYAPVDRESTSTLDADELAACEDLLAAESSATGIALALGTSTPTENGWHNSTLWIDPDTNTRSRYHKRALYGEDARHYVPGVDAAGSVVDFRGWRIGWRICFEFRFPEYFRELLRADVDLVLMGFSMVGAGGAKREIAMAHLRSRAAENGFFLATANNIRSGQEAPSCLLDPEGNTLAQASWDVDTLVGGRCVRAPRAPLTGSIRAHAKTLAGGSSGSTD